MMNEFDYNPEVDHYLEEGCGRCPLGGTPGCKVHAWTEELKHLRQIVLNCGLTEERKWGVPCYTLPKAKGSGSQNVVIIGAFKEYCVLSFFKGALLKDTDDILQKPGENTQAGRIIKFTSVQQIVEKQSVISAYVFEAIEVEKAGLQVDFNEKRELNYPDELLEKFAKDAELKSAFDALTPGRQRGYILYFSQPKQSKTRSSRIAKYTPKILAGKGLHDR